MTRTRDVLLALAFATLLACRQARAPEAQGREPEAQGRSGQGPAPAPARPATAAAAAAAAGHDADEHDADEHGRATAPEVSDLDRPVEELLAATCEHGKRTFECDECRYGVGVVRVPGRLLEAGLVRKATVARQHVEAPVALTGEVRFDERRVAHVSPRAEGTVRRVHAGLGERVRRGQAILELESVHVGEAESEYLSAQAALRLARASADRQERLHQEQITSQREYLSARQELEAAQIRARAAQERLLRLGVAKADLERLALAGRGPGGGVVVRAPADGTVLEMHAVPGELVKPDQSIVTLGDVSSVWVWADLHEDQLGRVLDARRPTALRAEVEVNAFPDTRFPGAVDLVGPTMDERTRTVKVRVAVANPGAKLRPGMFATVRISLPGQEEALAVPGAAVLSDEGRSFVFLHHHGDYWIRRPVVPGRAWGDWVEVKGGLAGGETVAADGAFLLKSDVLRSKMGAGCAD